MLISTYLGLDDAWHPGPRPRLVLALWGVFYCNYMNVLQNFYDHDMLEKF